MSAKRLNSTDSIVQPPQVLETEDLKYPESRVWPTGASPQWPPKWKPVGKCGDESLRQAVECNQQSSGRSPRR